MSSNSIQKLKENYSKQRRREDIQKKLAQKRKQLSIQCVKKEKQLFQSLIPIICHQNYEENRFLLRDFARSADYSYEMLPIAFISFDYLIGNPLDKLSWEILINLSYYEDFQIPQTQEFAHILIQFLNTEVQIASQFILNISGLPKCSLLCCRLVDKGIIEIIYHIIQKNIEIYYINSLENTLIIGKEDSQILIFNCLAVLGNFFNLKPILETSQLCKICEILNFQTKSNNFLKQVHDQAIFRLLKNAFQNFSSQKYILQILAFQFSKTIINSFFTYEEESLLFMKLCVKNQVRLNEKLIQNLFVSIKSKNNKNKVLSLRLLQNLLIPQQTKQQMQIQNHNQNNFGNFITNTLPSLQEFSQMFSLNNGKNESTQNKNQQKINILMTYSVLFNQNFENNFKILIEIYQNSGQKIQQEISSLIKMIFKCLIRQVHNFEEEIQHFYGDKYHVPQMEEYFLLAVQQEETFIFLSECLQSTISQITLDSLEILRDLIVQFKQQRYDNQKMNNEIGFQFLLNQLHKFNIHASLQSLINCQNQQIASDAEAILNLISEDY